MTACFVCPNCKKPLLRTGMCYLCESGHSFDVSKDGYVNLVLPSQKGSKLPGDNPEMVAARREFLDMGYFNPLAQELSGLVAPMLLKSGENIIVDAGCGEGYYDVVLSDFLSAASIPSRIIGMDISKSAVCKAAKACKSCGVSADFIVGSSYNVPLKSECACVVLNVFAPHCPEEFARILSRDGHVLVVVPAARHLWELKEFLYDEPYENPPAVLDFAGFELVRAHSVTYEMKLDRKGALALFEMTPYAYKTPQDAKLRLQSCNGMSVSASFEIYDFRKAHA